MRKFILILVLMVANVSCNNKKEQKKSDYVNDLANAKEYKTASGKSFFIDETHPVGTSLSTVVIQTKGFENEFRTSLEDLDPLNKVLHADLNNDGFEEIYLVTKGGGSGAYMSLFGFSSNQDKSVSKIAISEISELDLDEEGLFNGYMGLDDFNLMDGMLFRTFKKFIKGDIAAKPTGGESKIYYQLISGEAGLILEARKTAYITAAITKDCTGTYLMTEAGDLKVCNADRLASLDSGNSVEVQYAEIPNCEVKEIVACMMHHPNIGSIKIISPK